MASVGELSDPWANFMCAPGRGRGYCRVCTTFVDPAYVCCYRCAQNPSWLDAVLPISYEERGGQLHTYLAGYKRWSASIAQPVRLQLAAVIWRFIARHEACLARKAGVDAFDLITTVPSSDRARDADHPLRAIVGETVEPFRARYERLLYRSAETVDDRAWDSRRFETSEKLSGERVLLIDDTWTTGARAQTAAAALRSAGASAVAALVVGRFINPDFADNRQRLARHPKAFAWDTCVLHF